jgi:hypothetical protein
MRAAGDLKLLQEESQVSAGDLPSVEVAVAATGGEDLAQLNAR